MKVVQKGGICTPLGFSSAGIGIDVKGNGGVQKDFGVITSMVPCECAAVFTKNKVVAAPVKSAKATLAKSEKVNAILVNSGNANACTGEQGMIDYADIVAHFADELSVPKDTVYMSSTGVIGEVLPKDKFIDAASDLLDAMDDEDDDFAESILTTDTVVKKIAVLVETSGGIYVVGGVAKGSGMIAPEMATMLGFITTDAMVDKAVLDRVLNGAAQDSFNCITVDGDMSTNDSVFLLANGMSGIAIHSEKDIQAFQEAVTYVSLELAKMIVMDAEGAQKFVAVHVKNALTDVDAQACAFKVANSPLVKTMFAGEDPNWGRLMASAGASLVELEEEKIDIYFNDLKYVENGALIDPALEGQIHGIMKKRSFDITIDLNMGACCKTAYTSDLTKEYISINADYRS